MDKERELKWTFGAIKTFEKRAKEILKRLDIRNDKGQQIATQPMHAGFILANFLRISDIIEAAIGAATGLSSLVSIPVGFSRSLRRQNPRRRLPTD